MKIRAAYLSAVVAALLALGASPSAVRAEAEAEGCVIKCEKCSCNTRTGICDCTNCEIKCSAT